MTKVRLGEVRAEKRCGGSVKGTVIENAEEGRDIGSVLVSD